MQNLVSTYLEKFKLERENRRRLVCILLVLAMFVGFGVYWQMRLSGAAITNEVICGIEEHTHSEDCYELVLTCEQDEAEVTAGHIHDDSCYEQQSILVPGQEGHTHSEACYQTEFVQSCGQDEAEGDEGHIHNDSCYQQQSALICGQEEREHIDDSYQIEQVLICEQEETETVEGHIHNDSCYTSSLICELEEHAHTVSCISNTSADVESASTWEATLPALSGVWTEDLVAIAESQLGYTESTENFILGDNGSDHKGYTRYGAWYGIPYGDWCAMFASFCLHYAGVPEETFPQAAGVYAWTVALKEHGMYISTWDAMPRVGDLVFFDYRGDDRSADHVGIVVLVDEEQGIIEVIEGNSGNAVRRNTYALGNALILGFGLLPEQELTEEDTRTTSFTTETDSILATVELTDALPRSSSFVVEHYDRDSDRYEAALEQVKDYLSDGESDLQDALVLDLHFEDEEGQELHIEGSADVSLAFLETLLQGSHDVRILHISDDGEIEDVTRGFSLEGEGLEVVQADLTTDGFSEFIILTAGDDSDGERNSTRDLEEYIKTVDGKEGESASIDVVLYTTDDRAVARNEETGTTTVEENTTYKLSLIIQSSAGFENGTYTYPLPAGVNLEDQSGDVLMTDGTKIGTWSVSTGSDGKATFYIDIAQGETEYQDVTVQFSAETTFTRQQTGIQIGDETFVIEGDNELAVAKGGSSYKSNDSLNYSDRRNWSITFSQSGVPLAGTIVMDITSDGEKNLISAKEYDLLSDLSSQDARSKDTATYAHQHFHTGIPVSVTLKKPSDGSTYTWTVPWSSEALTLYYASATGESSSITKTKSETLDRIVAFQYIFPNSVEAKDKDGNTVMLDLTDAAALDSYAIEMHAHTTFDVFASAGAATVYYYNTVYVSNNKGEGKPAENHTNATLTGGKQRKGWERGSDGLSVDWTVITTIPAGYMTSYEIVDRMSLVDKDGKVVDLKHDDYASNEVLTMTISEGTTINGHTIEAGTYEIYNINGTVPQGAPFVYYYVNPTSSRYGYYVLGMQCHCDEEGGQNRCTIHDSGSCDTVIYTSDSQTKYCVCWQLNQEAVINLTYTTETNKMVELLNTYGKDGNLLQNISALYYGRFNGKGNQLKNGVWMAGQTVRVPLTLVDKTLKTMPTIENNFTANYEVKVNENHYQLTQNGASIKLTDTLSNSLTYVSGSVDIKSTDAANNTTTLTYGQDYTATYDSATHQLVIVIDNPGTSAYTISYDAQMLNPSANLEYTNTVKLSWRGEEISVETDKRHVTEVATAGVTYLVAIQKTDGLTGKLLEGAVFGLYDSSGKLMASDTTGADGQVTFKTVAGASDNALTFREHTLYYLQETKAPEGYVLDDSKYYFYFCEKGDDCEDCATLTAGLPNGVHASEAHKLTTGTVIGRINNQITYGFYVMKVDQNSFSGYFTESGVATDLSGIQVLGGAEFYVYYESPVLDGEGNPTDVMNKYYAILDSNNAVTGWNSSSAQASRIQVGTDGLAFISGLPAGTYYMEEVTVPDGYNGLSGAIKITIAADGNIAISYNDKVVQFTTADVTGDSEGEQVLVVANTSAAELPATGGAGSEIYVVTGVTLCAVALALLLHRRKRIAGR